MTNGTPGSHLAVDVKPNSLPRERVESLIRLAAFAVSIGIICYLTYLKLGFRSDDALIYARYVRNVWAGHGLVFNPGEKWNAVTSPLYVWLLVAVASLSRDVPLVANVIGGLCTAGTVYLLVFRLFPAEYPGFVGAGAGILYATANINYLTFGMESPLLILLLTGMLVAYRMQRWTLFAVLVGLAGLTRGEAVFLAGPLYLGAWRQTKRLPWRPAIISLLVMLPFLMFNLAYYGHVYPDTLMAKVIQGRSGLWGRHFVFARGAVIIMTRYYVGTPLWCLVAFLSALAFLGGRKSQPAWWLALFLSSLSIFYSALPVPAYGWYLLPFVWSDCILVPLGVLWAYRWSSEHFPRFRYDALAVGMVGFLFALCAHVRQLPRLPDGPEAYYVRASGWLKKNLPAGTSVGAVEVGHLGWYTDLRIVDIVGLASPRNAGYLARGDLDSWVREYKPDYILMHTYHFWPTEVGAAHALMRNEYAVQDDFCEPGLVLLGPPKAFPSVGALLGQGFDYDEHVREGAYMVRCQYHRGLLISPGFERQFHLSFQPHQVFEAYLGVPQEPLLRWAYWQWFWSPEQTGEVTAVAAIQLAGQPVTEILRKHVLRGAWEKVSIPIPAIQGSSYTLVLKTEAADAAANKGDNPVVWGEPRVYSRP